MKNKTIGNVLVFTGWLTMSIILVDTLFQGLSEAEAKKLVVSAQAEKEANELRRQSLSPLLIQQQWIEKWDGKVPVYSGSGSNTFLDISKLK